MLWFRSSYYHFKKVASATGDTNNNEALDSLLQHFTYVTYCYIWIGNCPHPLNVDTMTLLGQPTFKCRHLSIAFTDSQEQKEDCKSMYTVINNYCSNSWRKHSRNREREAGKQESTAGNGERTTVQRDT